MNSHLGTDTYEGLYKIARTLLQQRPHSPAILRAALSTTCEALNLRHGCIVMFDDDGALRHSYVVGIELEGEAASSFWHRLISQGIIGIAQREQRTQIIADIQTDSRWIQFAGNTTLPHSGSAMSVPFKSDTHVLGVMMLVAEAPSGFDEATTAQLEEIAALISDALQNAVALENARSKETSYRRMVEKAQAEKTEAARHEQLRRDLAAMTYHDMRNPLQNIQISLTGLQRLLANNDSDMIAQMLQLARRSADQINRMVRSLLDIERLEQGRTMLNLKSSSLENMLMQALEMVRPLAQESEQSLTCDVAVDLPPLQIDSDMIQRVVINLLENAVKHTPSGGNISLSAGMVGESVRISVADTGPGVPRQFRDEVFDKFFRIKYSNAPNGVGLGLAFCRLAIEAHGGHIWVENNATTGAVFSFTLPVVTPASVSQKAVVVG